MVKDQTDGSSRGTALSKGARGPIVPPVPSILQEEIDRLRRESKPAPPHYAEAPEPSKPTPKPHQPRIPPRLQEQHKVHTTITSLSPNVNKGKPAGHSPAGKQAHRTLAPDEREGQRTSTAPHPAPGQVSGGEPSKSADASFSSKKPEVGGAEHEHDPAGKEEGGQDKEQSSLARKVTVVQLSTSQSDSTHDAPTNSISHTYSTIGRLLGCTGINGRADGQFSILAGVAVGPDGLLFVSDRDTQSHVDVLRIEVEGSQVAANLSEVLTADTRIIVPLSTGGTSRPDSNDGSTQGRKFSIIDPETGVKKVSIEPGAIDEAASMSAGGDMLLTEGMAGPSSGRGSPAKSTRSQGKSILGRGGLDTSIDGMSLDRGAWTAHSQGQGWPAGAPTQTGSFKAWERRDAGGGAAGGGVTTFLRHGHTVPMRASGITFVADSDNHCLQVLRADGTHLRRIGTYGSAGGQFNSVQGVAVLCEQNADTYLLYAADTCNHRVQVFSFHKSDGTDIKLEKIIGSEGKEDEQFRYPVGICVIPPTGDDESSGRLIVADTGNDRIQIFTTGGEHLFSVGAAGRQPQTDDGTPCFRSPFDVACCGGLLFVTDEGNHRLQLLTADGKYVRSVGTQGNRMGHFIRPRCVYATNSGAVLVSDQENQRVQLLYPDVDGLGEQIFRWLRLK